MAVTIPEEPKLPYADLQRQLEAARSDKKLYQAIVNAPFEYMVEVAHLFLGFMSLVIVDRKAGVVKTAAVSDTEHYRTAVSGINFTPAQYKVSLNDHGNSIIQAISSGKPQGTTDWGTLSRPQTGPEPARLNQANSGIAYSIVYPLDSPSGGALMFCYYQYQADIGTLQHEFMVRYARLVSESLTKHFKR